MKPVKRGIKVWVLANINGYFWNLQVHNKYLTQISVTTCDRFTLEKRQLHADKGLGARVLKDLTFPLRGQHHHIYCDNFFTSVKLFEELEEAGLYACGTARSDR